MFTQELRSSLLGHMRSNGVVPANESDIGRVGRRRFVYCESLASLALAASALQGEGK